MKKALIIGTVVVFGIGAYSAIAGYNTIYPLEEAVNVSYGQYQNQLKRQADLIPNLADVVKGYMTTEQKTMVDVATARSGAISQMKPSDVANNPELQKRLIEAQANMGRAMVTLNAVREAYPQLKSDKAVEGLMVELSGTQNRVTVARGNTQRAVNEYNLAVRQFPRVLVAKVIGYSPKPYFEAGAENQNAPRTNFSVK